MLIFTNDLNICVDSKIANPILLPYGLLGSNDFKLVSNFLLYSSNDEITHFCLTSSRLHGAEKTNHLSVDRHNPVSSFNNFSLSKPIFSTK